MKQPQKVFLIKESIGTGINYLNTGADLDTVIGVVVTAQNGTTKTYTIIVHRKDNNAKLSDLKIDGATIEDFDANTLTYNYTVENNVTSVTIGATSESAVIQGITGLGSQNLDMGDDYNTTLTIDVTAEDGTTITYTINVHRKFANIAFTDLEGYEWAQEYIDLLVSEGIISGYPDLTFRPGNNVTRAEFAKMLTSAYKIVDETATSTFTDVAIEQWYYKYVASAQSEGLVIGNGDGIFSPNAEITREEMFTTNARVINKYLGIEILGNEDAETAEILSIFYDGYVVAEWARGFTATNVKNGVVVGSLIDGKLMLNPKKAVTRSEAAVMLGRIIKME